MFQNAVLYINRQTYAKISLIYHHINVYFIMTFIVYKKKYIAKKDFNKIYTKIYYFP